MEGLDLCRPSTHLHRPALHPAAEPEPAPPQDKHLNLDPLLQCAHTKYSTLEPRVQHAIRTTRRSRLNILSSTLSARARASTLATYHHALAGTTLLGELEARGITTVGKLICPTVPGRRAGRFVCSTPVEYTPSKDENTNPFQILPWEAPPH